MIAGRSYIGESYGQVYENFRHCDELIHDENLELMASRCDVIFMALPHGLSGGKVSEALLSETKVIDLGADFRLSDADVYEKWYGAKHENKELLKEAVYGLTEIHRDTIAKARLIANPGCYTTCSILALYPLLKEGVLDRQNIVIDAKSGVSGAGRVIEQAVHFCEATESVKAYKVASHRHTPEIEEQLSLAAGEELQLIFTPHLIPMNRGILSTCYGKPARKTSARELQEIYEEYYGKEYFIRLCKPGVFPETKWVKASNFCDIAATVDERTSSIIVISALDNLGKGAAGQAVQNMNLIFGLDEKTGLDNVPAFPV
jgi:N-acetyl-gamma-glutamyl-phosphate reductase